MQNAVFRPERKICALKKLLRTAFLAVLNNFFSGLIFQNSILQQALFSVLSLDRTCFLLRFPRWKPAPQPGTLRWGDFLIGQKVTKDPPKAGPSPALWNPPRGTGRPCVLLFSALDWFLSHRWRRHSMGRACSSVDGTSTARALPWCATVPSCRGPGSRRRERRLAKVGPDVEIAQL